MNKIDELRKKLFNYKVPDYYLNRVEEVFFDEDKLYIEIEGDLKGKFSLKNNLNNLTGKEWKFSTKTVINKSYPFNLQHKLRKEHGGQKPPELCSDIIKIFTKENDKILDPFVGVGGSLIGATLINRIGIGIDLNMRWKEIYEEVCELEKLKKETFLIGDSFEKLDEIENNSIDFIITDIPYWDIDKIKHTRSKNASKSSLGNFNNEELKSKEKWISDMKMILNKSLEKLKKGKYMAVFIGDIYYNNSYHILHADIANAISNENIVLKSNIVWYDVSKSLHVYGYPYSYVPSLIHQNILIFKKES